MFWPLVQIEKSLQSRVLVVRINCDVGDALVFEELDEIDCEEAFADTAFAVKDEVETFSCALRFEHPNLGDAWAPSAGLRSFVAIGIRR
jgi:hypothetical protein